MSENYKAIVWSKNNCAYCDKVKALLKTKNVEVEERNIEVFFTIEDLRKEVPNAKSVPQVFINGKYIGGYTSVEEYFNKL